MATLAVVLALFTASAACSTCSSENITLLSPVPAPTLASSVCDETVEPYCLYTNKHTCWLPSKLQNSEKSEQCTVGETVSTWPVSSAVWPPTLTFGIMEGSSARSLSSTANTTCAYPAKSPITATSLIVQVVLLWATALFGCCILACVTIYCGYIIGAIWYATLYNGDVIEVLKVVQERTREIAATKNGFIPVLHNGAQTVVRCAMKNDLRRTYFITEPLGTPIVCTVNLNRKDILDNLKKKVYSKTGVPPQLQKLFYKNRLINDSDSLKRVPHEANIVQIIAIVGGGNECNVCFDKSQLFCSDCDQYLCFDCNERVHRHPKRSQHSPQAVDSLPSAPAMEDSVTLSEDEYDMELSPSIEKSFVDAELIATLAERFQLTSFKQFQKDTIEAMLAGKDTLVLYPTGSGKSLCFQFPPVYLGKKAIIVTPTISLMQDQVQKLNSLGIQSVYLGSAQFDKQAESHALDPTSEETLIFVTPEWITKSCNQQKVQELNRNRKLALIAIDEAHLVSEWAAFRNAFSELKELKHMFCDVPIMALSATATTEVEDKIRQLLRNPVTQKTSVNRPNITLNVEELHQDTNVVPAKQFAARAAEIAGTAPAIIYTDFIADIGPIVSSLSELGIEAVGYHGEMDSASRCESHGKWKSGEVQIIVATKAFGMGIDKADIRNVIRNGVPENVLSWAQELGRAGRDGQQACATILYRRNDISHANAWVLNNLQCKEHCSRILKGFSNSWRYVQSHLAGICRRRMLLDLFGETDTEALSTGTCCDVCISQASSDTPVQDMRQELAVLIDALDQVGCRGEVKVSEWIRGSKLSWTDEFNKKAMSYGNHCGKDINYWRSFMRQCSVNKLVDMELRSMIKSNGHYSVYGVFLPTDKGREAVTNSEPVLLPHFERCNQLTVSRAGASGCSATSEGVNQQAKGKRIGKGSHILPVIRKCLKDSENWKQIESKQDYQFLGTYAHPSNQNLYFIPDLTELEQSSDNPHYLWNDIQFSKGQLNKDRKIEVEIGGKKENVYYRTAPCIGVKTCTVSGCTYIAPIREKRPCPHHKNKLVKSEGCPVEFVYVYPEDGQDKRRWIGGLVRCQKYMAKNLHNHLPHAAMKISQCVKERIHHAIASNPTLTPTDIACGKGVGFTPSAVDVASSHLGRVAREVKKVKESKGFTSKNWSPCDFELTADEIDQEDEMLSGDVRDSGHTYKSYGRPYLCAAGIEDSIQYVFVSSPLMSKLAAGADFMQCDITYNETREYPYIFNAVIFNYTTMEWMVIGRIRMNKQDSNAYALAFRKLFSKIQADHPHYSVGETLLGLVVDWSDAQIKGLQHAIGKEKAEQLLKGCKVHWLRSCQRVAEKVSRSHDRSRERNVFESIAKCIPHLKSAVQVIACFEALCGVRTIVELLNKVPSICRTEDAQFVDKNCDWTAAKNWAQWWTRATHLRMLSKTFSSAPDTWTNCPTTTNAVERKNKDCKTDRPQPLKLAMINVYRIDKNVCCKHIAAEQGASISYRSRDLEAKKKSAATRQQQRKAALHPDRMAQHGPPDRVSNFVCDGVRSLKQSSKRKSAPNPSIVQTGTKKKAISVSDSIVPFIPNSHPEVLGKAVKVKFLVKESGKEEWFDGMIISYNGMSGLYGIYFPCDGQTVEMSLDDEDLELV